jgi:hypothetical protein
MKMLISMAFGLLSSFVAFLLFALMFIERDWHRTTPPALLIWAFSFTWAISSLLLANNVQTVLNVFRRGFLLGTIEWVGVLFASVAYLRIALFEKFSVSMLIICLIGLAIIQFCQPGDLPPESGRKSSR